MSFDLNDALNALQEHMEQNSFPMPNLKLDGSINRFTRGGSSRKKTCWAIANLITLRNGSSVIRCAYGDWKTRESYHCTTYCIFGSSSKNSEVTVEDIRRVWK